MPLTLLPKFSLLKTKYRLENEKKEKKKKWSEGILINHNLSLHPRVFQIVVLKWRLTEIFIFTLLCGASKGFMKALKAFINPFEAP